MLLLNSIDSSAKQLSFRKDKQATQTHFEYRFVDHKRQTQQLSFTLDNATMFNRFRKFKGYKPERMQQTVLMTLKKAAAKVDRKKVDIQFIEHADRFEMKLSGDDQQLTDNTLKTLLKMKAETQEKYVKRAYYNVLVNQQGTSGIKPDHVRFANESRKDILALTNAIKKANPNLRGRRLIEYILAFVQSIPYSTLESRYDSNGAGFNAPLRLINNNQGDCDSKVTLMASIVNAMYPRIKVVIIYLSDHALIGVQMTHSKNDKSIKIKDREYILAEPTGPAMLPFGSIASSSAVRIDSGQFSHEVF